jgi:hypothetical protein
MDCRTCCVGFGAHLVVRVLGVVCGADRLGEEAKRRLAPTGIEWLPCYGGVGNDPDLLTIVEDVIIVVHGADVQAGGRVFRKQERVPSAWHCDFWGHGGGACGLASPAILYQREKGDGTFIRAEPFRASQLNTLSQLQYSVLTNHCFSRCTNRSERRELPRS